MSQKYALPCPCGSNVPVESRHAGGTVTCLSCGDALDVPKLREIKTLDLIEESPAKQQSGWSQLQGVLFAVGLLLLAVAAGSALYTYQFRASYQKITRPKDEDIQFEFDIQTITLVDSWQSWKQFKEFDITSRRTPPHVFARNRIAVLDRWLIFFGLVGGLGFLSMVISVVLTAATR